MRNIGRGVQMFKIWTDGEYYPRSYTFPDDYDSTECSHEEAQWEREGYDNPRDWLQDQDWYYDIDWS